MKNDRILLALVCLLMLLKRFILLPFELNYEEGKEIECILNIMNGQLVYRDFHWQYGPGPIYFIALLFKIFGVVNLYLPRIVVSLVAVATTFYAYKVARFYLSSIWSFWAALLSSSGLVFRENTYGHGFAYLGMIASFYFLLRFFKNRNQPNLLVYSGLFVFLALLSKPVLFGIGAVFAGIFCLVLWAAGQDEKRSVKEPLIRFLIPSLVPGALVYGYLIAQTSAKSMFAKLVPMSSGSYNMGEALHWKALFPPLNIFPLADWIAGLNDYLVEDLRWWMIILTFLGGVLYFLRSFFKERKPFADHLFLTSLLIYALLIECETIVLINRPPTFFINMLPTFILLGLFFIWFKKNVGGRYLVFGAAFLLSVIYFFYPPLNAGYYHWTHDKPLGLKYAKTIRVPEYTYNGYRRIAGYIQENTPADQPILFAGYDSFIHLFSERRNLFSEDFATFVRVTFSPYNRKNDDFGKAFWGPFEKKIIERVQADPPSIIIVPTDYLTPKAKTESAFIKYLLLHWQKKESLNSDVKPGPFDKSNLSMEVFAQKD